MRRDVERALLETEDFLHRQLGSAAARELSKRKVKRGMSEVLRRVRRAALIVLVLMAALIGASIFTSIGFFTWLLAIPTIFLAALISMFWPSRRSRREEARSPAAGGAPAELPLLAGRTEEWLLERCQYLPRPALPAADFILGRLRELQPELARVNPQAPVAGEAQRLIGQHLPRLVDAYLELPPHDQGGENSRRLAESLDTVAEELDRISEDICRERGLSFETQTRFIESRYRAREL
jgi:hypothetical protein